ncbi:prepilin-type N-terminal cleavage/methylation domain-containing protein [Patescibacteria group bacterium]|nr:prepilin-type N-terminal cleavage/methylation domain-containing protein [Patescibacteria group bacterium]
MIEKSRSPQKGFTLVELIIVLAIIVILAAVIISIYFFKNRLAEARNASRFEEVQSLASALTTYQVDHNGFLPPGIDNKLRMLGTETLGCDVPCGISGEATESSCLNLSSFIAYQYLAQVPDDPLFGSEEKTYYAVRTLPGGRMAVMACGSELNVDITSEK